MPKRHEEACSDVLPLLLTSKIAKQFYLPEKRLIKTPDRFLASSLLQKQVQTHQVSLCFPLKCAHAPRTNQQPYFSHVIEIWVTADHIIRACVHTR